MYSLSWIRIAAYEHNKFCFRSTDNINKSHTQTTDCFNALPSRTLEPLPRCCAAALIFQLVSRHFYARQLYRQVLLRARISHGNSVRPPASPAMGHWGTCPPSIDFQHSYFVREQIGKMYANNAILRNFYQFLAHFCHFLPTVFLRE